MKSDGLVKKLASGTPCETEGKFLKIDGTWGTMEEAERFPDTWSVRDRWFEGFTDYMVQIKEVMQ